MFKSVHPVCCVLDMTTHLAFWRRLGFEVAFSSARPAENADYVGVARQGLELHLQTFTPEQLKATQIMAIRVEMTDRKSLETLHDEWVNKVNITAKLSDQPWGTREFGFYDPVNTPFFFYVDKTW